MVNDGVWNNNASWKERIGAGACEGFEFIIGVYVYPSDLN